MGGALACASSMTYRFVQPYGRDVDGESTVVSEHAPAADAFAKIDRLATQMVRTGAKPRNRDADGGECGRCGRAAAGERIDGQPVNVGHQEFAMSAIQYSDSVTPQDFLHLAIAVWPGIHGITEVLSALARTMNIGALGGWWQMGPAPCAGHSYPTPVAHDAQIHAARALGMAVHHRPSDTSRSRDSPATRAGFTVDRSRQSRRHIAPFLSPVSHGDKTDTPS